MRVKRGTKEWKMVYKGNRAKFLQNKGARMELFESMVKILVEASRGDQFWGIGLGMGDGRNGDPSKWQSICPVGERSPCV